MVKKIYYLFSSITFLQFYIPICIEAKKRGYKNIFILRQNYKKYANPLLKENFNILEPYLHKYEIKIKIYEDINIKNIKGLVFMIDGDIYGPPRSNGPALKESLLHKLDSNNVTKVSLTEHMQFATKYGIIEPYIDYFFFESIGVINLWNNYDSSEYSKRNLDSVTSGKGYNVYDSPKNIYNINTKFDNINLDMEKSYYYNKFNLNKEKKYCLLLYSKFLCNNIKVINSTTNIMTYLRNLGYTIILKTRPKSENDIPKKHIEENIYICSDSYPNETLELLQISDLCIFFSSSAQTECLYCEVPCISFQTSIKKIWIEHEYLAEYEKFFNFVKFNEWIDITFDNFKKILKLKDEKGSTFIKDLKNKFINVKNSSERIINFFENKKIYN